MKNIYRIIVLSTILIIQPSIICFAQQDGGESTSTAIATSDIKDDMDEDQTEDSSGISISDPLEPINRVFYHFNDRLYFWFLKPAASGYMAIAPEPVRVGVRNIFYNLAFPIRFTNCLFQAKFDGAANEFARFFVNSTIGMAGFLDIATKKINLSKEEEDLGQTLGSYGISPGFYINWPIFGPSSLRDTFGLAGDAFLDPVNYIVPRMKYNLSVKTYNNINKASLVIGDYEDLIESALDPYISVRDAYYQYRLNKIKE